jgi:iron complex outermembrane receptor protein
MGGATRLETRVQLQRHNIVEMEDDPDSAAIGVLVEVPVFDLTLTTGLGEGLLHHSLARSTNGTIGVTGKLQSSATDGVIPVVPGASQSAAGIFLLERLDRGPVTLLGGVRGDLARVDADDHPARSFRAFTWSAGAAWRLAQGVSLTGNAGTAWRAPTLFELYASGPRLGEARYEYGDPSLGEERSFNLDGGLGWRGSRARGRVTTYRNDFSDFLFIQPTDRTEDGYQVFEYRRADALLTGGEASLEVDAARWLTLTAKGDYVRGTNRTRDEPLPLMPPRRLVFGGEVHGAWAGAGSWAYLGGEVESVAAPDRLNPYDYAVDSYTLVNLSGGLRGTFMGRDGALELRVRNVAATEYKDFLSRYKRFALNPGRDVVLRLRMDF